MIFKLTNKKWRGKIMKEQKAYVRTPYKPLTHISARKWENEKRRGKIME